MLEDPGDLDLLDGMEVLDLEEDRVGQEVLVVREVLVRQEIEAVLVLMEDRDRKDKLEMQVPRVDLVGVVPLDSADYQADLAQVVTLALLVLPDLEDSQVVQEVRAVLEDLVLQEHGVQQEPREDLLQSAGQVQWDLLEVLVLEEVLDREVDQDNRDLMDVGAGQDYQDHQAMLDQEEFPDLLEDQGVREVRVLGVQMATQDRGVPQAVLAPREPPAQQEVLEGREDLETEDSLVIKEG